MRLHCWFCGYIYDEDEGNPSQGVKPHTKITDLPDDYRCPDCGVILNSFPVDRDEIKNEGKKISLFAFFKYLFLVPFSKNKNDFKAKNKTRFNIKFSFNLKNAFAAAGIMIFLIIYSIAFFNIINFEHSFAALLVSYIGTLLTHLLLALFCFLKIGSHDLISRFYFDISFAFITTCIFLRAIYETIGVLIASSTPVSFVPILIFEMWWHLIAIPLSFFMNYNIFRKANIEDPGRHARKKTNSGKINIK